MTPILIFFLALVLILVMTTWFKIHPFLSLITVSIFVGILAGKPFEALESILTGMGRVIYHLGLIIVCGSIIGMTLDGIGATSVIADDIIRISKKPVLAVNLLGFLVAIPLMCCILAYVIFIPIAREIASKLNIPIGVIATSLCLGTLASYELIYPAPGVYSAAKELGVVGADIVILGLMLAIPTTLVGYLYAEKFCRFGKSPTSVAEKRAKVNILIPVLPELGLPLEIVLMSIASGTFLVSHANDPYFWTMIELAEMEPSSGYRCYTVGGIVIGAVAFLMTIIAYLIVY
ncbi:MAG: hypothetical protein U9N01_05560 [Euryarchaeota archaeon]|nr:hypothetical protein [Euryarchaeota archaeon]